MRGDEGRASRISRGQDTCHAGNIKGVGHIYQQTFIDTYSKVAFCKLYNRKNALAVADALNSEAIPFFDSRGILLLRVAYGQGQRMLRKQRAPRIRAVP